MLLSRRKKIKAFDRLPIE